MYHFNIPNEREPTEKELIEGFIHYVATLLNLYGAPKHFVEFIRGYESKQIDKELICKIMQKGIDMIEWHKFILDRCPKMKIDPTEGSE